MRLVLFVVAFFGLAWSQAPKASEGLKPKLQKLIQRLSDIKVNTSSVQSVCSSFLIILIRRPLLQFPTRP